jgi:hypothetical protein
MIMGVRTMLRALFERIGRASWETRVAVMVPIIIALLSLPVMLGALTSDAPSPNADPSYGGPPPTLPATVPTISLPPIQLPITLPKPPPVCPPVGPICQ